MKNKFIVIFLLLLLVPIISLATVPTIDFGERCCEYIDIENTCEEVGMRAVGRCNTPACEEEKLKIIESCKERMEKEKSEMTVTCEEMGLETIEDCIVYREKKEEELEMENTTRMNIFMIFLAVQVIIILLISNYPRVNLRTEDFFKPNFNKFIWFIVIAFISFLLFQGLSSDIYPFRSQQYFDKIFLWPFFLAEQFYSWRYLESYYGIIWIIILIWNYILSCALAHFINKFKK